jgi:hypothetical protein
MTDDVLLELFSYAGVGGIAIICGEVSGNMEVIDVDSKHDFTNSLFDNFYCAIHKSNADIASRLCIGATCNKGYHLYYQGPVIGNDRVLARRATTSTEFVRGVGYRPCAVYAFLECNKDFTLAARRLLADGYGVPYKKRRRP